MAFDRNEAADVAFGHRPVLLDECMEGLAIRPGGRVASVIAYLALKALVAGGAWLLWRYMLTLKWEKLPARDLDTPQA